MLDDNRFAFGHDQHSVFDAMTSSRGLETLERFVHRLIAKTKCSVMHRHHGPRAEFCERADRFLGVHVNFPSRRRVISPDRQERDINLVVFADLAKPRKKRAVAAVKKRPSLNLDSESAKPAMEVGQETRAPVITRRERDLDRTKFDCLPIVEFMDDVEPEIVHEIPHPDRNDNWLVRCHPPQGASIEMVKMRMRDELPSAILTRADQSEG